MQSEREKTKEPDNQTIIELKEKLKKEPDNISLLIALGKEYFDVENYEAAEKVLKKAVSLDSLNANAFKLLASCLGQIGEEGYDPRIYMDTDFRTNLVFEAMKVLDNAVALGPDDIELRLMRAAMGVSFPFFIGRLDQGIDDLNLVIASDVPDSTMAEALYWIGFAYQKKARTHWIEIVSQYSGSEACQYVFNELAPGVKRIDFSKLTEHERKFLGWEISERLKVIACLETANMIHSETLFLKAMRQIRLKCVRIYK